MTGFKISENLEVTSLILKLLEIVTKTHKIIDDRIEKSIKGRQIGHSTPIQPGCCTGPAVPTDQPPFVSISVC